MFNIANYFKKFTDIENNSVVRRDAINSALSDICGMDGVAFDTKKGVLYVQAPPAAKSLIYTKKAALLAALSDVPGGRIIDIR